MLKLTVSAEQLRICEYLETLGWRRNMAGDYYLLGKQVALLDPQAREHWYIGFRDGGWWYLVPPELKMAVREGQTLAELRVAMSAGAVQVEQYVNFERPERFAGLRAVVSSVPWREIGGVLLLMAFFYEVLQMRIMP